MQSASTMNVVSVNVGLPREVVWKGRKVMTGIFKEPVGAKRVAVQRLDLEGDRQADLTVHGGTDKAVYAYPAEYYRYWREQFPDMQLPWGMFGENLTITGLTEETAYAQVAITPYSLCADPQLHEHSRPLVHIV